MAVTDSELAPQEGVSSSPSFSSSSCSASSRGRGGFGSLKGKGTSTSGLDSQNPQVRMAFRRARAEWRLSQALKRQEESGEEKIAAAESQRAPEQGALSLADVQKFVEAERENKACKSQHSVNCLGALRESLLSIECPLELAEAFEDAQVKCQSIASGKERAEQRLDEEATLREALFVSTLDDQRDEVTRLLGLMREQYQQLHNEYQDSLARIQDKMTAERGALMQKNKEELDCIFEERQNMEEHDIIEARQKRLDGFAEALEQQRERDEVESLAKKLRKETVIQELEKHLDKMLAAYQLNKEKLEYNTRVLSDRNKENLALVLAYKNRLNKCRETLSAIVERFNAMNLKYSALNVQCTEEFRRLRCQYRQIREKSLHFKAADERVYRDVWNASEQESRHLISLIHEADRCIHEQQLCMPYTPPSEVSGGQGVSPDEGGEGADLFSEAATTTFRSASSSGKDNSSFPRGQPASSASGGRSRSKEDSERLTGESGTATKSLFSPTKVKKVIELLTDACHFLSGPKKQAYEELTDEEQQLLDADTILKNVGVESQDDLDLLVSIFYQGQDDDDETLYVDADDVLRLLEDFMEEKRNLAVADVLPDKKKKKRQQSLGRAESERERLTRERREVKRFWTRLSKMLPDVTTRVWKALDEGLQRYHRLLVGRSETLAATLAAEKLHDSLSRQLLAFSQAPINTELQVPPLACVENSIAPHKKK
ncbi:putative NBP2b protein [Toxoplasma gondii VEG]|uniref:NBP2b protein n=1 Tax=Toxoplasma gondii (strain ATCC 50861 / VEG) TaxID=432359 RepID=V4YZE5_TOXGV|nr:putative NBP2b protein [Toxoplasma gondii VEG]